MKPQTLVKRRVTWAALPQTRQTGCPHCQPIQPPPQRLCLKRPKAAVKHGLVQLQLKQQQVQAQEQPQLPTQLPTQLPAALSMQGPQRRHWKLVVRCLKTLPLASLHRRAKHVHCGFGACPAGSKASAPVRFPIPARLARPRRVGHLPSELETKADQARAPKPRANAAAPSRRSPCWS